MSTTPPHSIKLPWSLQWQPVSQLACHVMLYELTEHICAKKHESTVTCGFSVLEEQLGGTLIRAVLQKQPLKATSQSWGPIALYFGSSFARGGSVNLYHAVLIHVSIFRLMHSAKHSQSHNEAPPA